MLHKNIAVAQPGGTNFDLTLPRHLVRRHAPFQIAPAAGIIVMSSMSFCALAMDGGVEIVRLQTSVIRTDAVGIPVTYISRSAIATIYNFVYAFTLRLPFVQNLNS